MQKNLKHYKYVSVWTEGDNDDILFGAYKKDLKMDLPIAKEMVNNRLEYSKGLPVYTIIDCINLNLPSKEAREYMSSPEGGLKGLEGAAFLSNNVVTRLIVNLFLSINKPLIPAKFFTKKEDAINWLNELKHTQKTSFKSEKERI